MQSSCQECNIYLVNVLQAQHPPLTPLICVLSYAAQHSIHATLGARCHRCATFNVDISVKTFQHQRGIPFCLALAPADAALSAWRDKRIQPWGVEVGRNIQQHMEAEAGKGLLGAGVPDPHRAGLLPPLDHLKPPCQREDNYITCTLK